MLKIKNIIIFVAIGVVIILLYVFFIKKDEEEASLVATNPTVVQTTVTDAPGSSVAQDFLSILLNVTSIKLNDAIFSDNAFLGLHDSSITLVQDGNEGRPNPFAPIGLDPVSPVPTIVPPPTSNPGGTTTPQP